jgi:hypothetical protein
MMNIVDHAFHRALKTIKHYQETIEAGVQLLLEHETLDEQALRTLWSKANEEKQPTLLPHKEQEQKPQSYEHHLSEHGDIDSGLCA